MRLLFTLLRRNLNGWQLMAFALANLLGAIIILIGLQAYRDAQYMLSADDSLMSSDYVVISKPVGLMTTLSEIAGGKAPGFSETEVKELQNLTEVDGVGAFQSARFSVSGQVSMGGQSMHSEMFLESVPDDYLDFSKIGTGVRWTASITDDFVPVIIPRSYLDLYNFGFASSHGLPRLSEGTIGRFPFMIYMGGRRYSARIIGFTSRLNTILVPHDFLKEANRLWGYGEEQELPSRLIIRTKANAHGANELLDIVQKKGYEVADRGDDALRLRTLVFGVIWVVVGIGSIVSLLSFFLLLVSHLLLIEKNRDKLLYLHSMGYSTIEVAKPYLCLSLWVDVFVWVLSALVSMVLYPWLASMTSVAMPQGMMAGWWCVAIAAVIGCAASALLHYQVICRSVNRHLAA